VADGLAQPHEVRAHRRTAGIYRGLIGAQVRGHASYRASFLLDLMANGAIPIIDIVAVFAMFQVTRTVGGFGAAEVIVMYGLSTTAFAMADLLVGNIEKIRVYVRQGLLDAVLVRPLPVLGQLVCIDFTIRRVARVVICVVVLAIALPVAGVDWTWARAALLVVVLVSGTAFFAAMFVGTATIAFWWIDSGEFANGFTYGGRDFTTYPVTVYNGFFRGLFAYAMGFAFVSYYPALALLGRADPLGLPEWLVWCAPLVAGLAAAFAAIIWRFGIRHYRSTGS
jgi:ABC-2 type transport system permease protein